MASLVIIRGASGSGKTTLAKSRYPSHKHVEADMFFSHSGKYEFDFTKIQDAHNWCIKTVKQYLDAGHNVVVSNTFTKLWEIQPYLDMGNPFEIIELKSQFKNVHGVPDEVVRRMKENFEPYLG